VGKQKKQTGGRGQQNSNGTHFVFRHGGRKNGISKALSDLFRGFLNNPKNRIHSEEKRK
jgi:hypothetical protein